MRQNSEAPDKGGGISRYTQRMGTVHCLSCNTLEGLPNEIYFQAIVDSPNGSLKSADLYFCKYARR